MTDMVLTVSDIREMLSSLFLAELPYDARMAHSQGSSLKPDFIPDAHLSPSATLANTVENMFNIPLDVHQGASLQQWAETVATEWLSTDRTLTFFTSGSTGQPKPTTHDFALHVQEVEALSTVFSGRKRIVSFVPRHHIYGFLFSILLPKAMDVEACWHVPLPTPGLIDALEEGDLMVAFPLLWGKLEELRLAFNPGIHGVTSTGPCPQEIIDALKENGLERMYEIYGSSETGGVGYRHQIGGYSLLPHWARADDSTLKRVFPDGNEGKFELQDVLQWDGETLVPQRRADNAVQVAGINVYPGRIARLLQEHPAVAKCAVRLMRPEEGTRLKALIVPANRKDAPKDLLVQIRQWAKDKLSPYEMPGDWKIARRLPTNAMGKLQDW